MVKKKYIFLMLIAIVGISILAVQRIEAENHLKSVDFVLDYEEAQALAEQSDKDIQWWLEKFHELGFNRVALKERTFENLKQSKKTVKTTMRDTFVQNIDWQKGLSQNSIDFIENHTSKFDLIAQIGEKPIYEDIKKGIKKRYPEGFAFFDEDDQIVVLKGTPDEALYAKTGVLLDEEGDAKRTLRTLSDSKLSWIGLGFDKNDIEIIKNSHMEPLLRPSNFSRHSKKLVEAFASEMEESNVEVPYLIFQGDSVIGHDTEMTEPVDAYRFMKKNNIGVGLIESGVQRGHTKQVGIKALTKMLDYEAVRIFPVVGYIQKRYKWYGYEGAKEIENTLYRAITERNIRSVYFRPFRTKDSDVVYVTDWEPYEKTFSSLKQRLSRHGIVFGKHSYMPKIAPHPFELALVAYGLIALGLYMFTRYIPFRKETQILLLSLMVALTTGALFLAPHTSALLLAFGTTILLPVAGGFVLLRCLKKLFLKSDSKEIWLFAFLAYFGVAALSLVGGLAVGGLLSHSDYLLEIRYFRGVKASQIMPLAIFSVLYILEMGYKQNLLDEKLDTVYWADIKKPFHENVKVIHLFILAFVGVLGAIYIARTGHETKIQPSQIEMIFRNGLEIVFLARPRSKELLIAFPALALALGMGANKNKTGLFALCFLSMLGLTSVLNTFCHLRTPLYLSVFRTIFSMVIGGLLGLGIFILYKIGKKMYRKWRKEGING